MRMKHRSLIAILLLNIITLGLYQIYWYFITKTEMNTLNKRELKVPFFLWFFIPIINIWWFWRFAKALEGTTKGSLNRWLAFLAPLIIYFSLGVVLELVAWVLSIQSGFSYTGIAFVNSYFNGINSFSFNTAHLWLIIINGVVVLLPVFYYQSNLNKVAR